MAAPKVGRKSSSHRTISPSSTFNGKPGLRKLVVVKPLLKTEYWIIEADGRSIGSPLSRLSVMFHVEHPSGGL
jgi:hypothetical protein